MLSNKHQSLSGLDDKKYIYMFVYSAFDGNKTGWLSVQSISHDRRHHHHLPRAPVINLYGFGFDRICKITMFMISLINFHKYFLLVHFGYIAYIHYLQLINSKI